MATNTSDDEMQNIVPRVIAATYVKLPPPRQLTKNETLDTLDHWKSIFRSYFRRDSIFKQFLASECSWDPNQPNYGLQDQDGQPASDRKDALIDFLNNLAGFLPHSYLTTKLEKNTKCMNDCWNIIEEHYNVQVTSETLLDFESLKKNPDENYRQFYERLLQHTRLHLAPVDAEVEDVKNTERDKISISLMNFVALQWLQKIDIQLIKIVKIEYSTELRAYQQLAKLVPRIAPNIDSLLSRYSTGSLVSKVSTYNVTENSHDETHVDEVEQVRKINTARSRGGGGRFQGSMSRGRRGGPSSKSNQFCAGCYSLSKQLNVFIDFKHRPADCVRQEAVSRMLYAEEEFPVDENEDFYEDGKAITIKTECTNGTFKNKFEISSSETNQVPGQAPANIVLNINLNQNPGETNQSSHTLDNNTKILNSIHNTESHFSDIRMLTRKIENLERKKYLWSKNNGMFSDGLFSTQYPVHLP